MYTTLSKLAKAGACRERFRHLVNALGGIKTYGKHTPVSYQSIMELNGIIDCVWALCHGGKEPLHIARLWALACVQEIKYRYHYPPLNTIIRMMHLYLHGEITVEELSDTSALYHDLREENITDYDDYTKLSVVSVVRFAFLKDLSPDIYDALSYEICFFPRPIPLDRQMEILTNLLQQGAKQ